MAVDLVSHRTQFVEVSKVVISGTLNYDPEDEHDGWYFEDGGIREKPESKARKCSEWNESKRRRELFFTLHRL